ncbi:MAG: pseudaminic acid synthase [Planctomycetota bacterium]
MTTTTTTTTITIGDRRIGAGQPCYTIAELSANHHHSLARAKDLVRAAADCGADAVKLQTYTPDTMTIASDREPFRIGKGTIWEGKNLHDLYGEAYTPWEWQPGLKRLAESLGMQCFSSPFDETAVDFLEQMDVPAYKIASFELVDLALIRKAAATGKPLIISTGMGTLPEIDEAVRTARDAGAREIALLKCSSAYPAPASDIQLHGIPQLAATFGVPAGLSDHTLGIAVPVAAVALGACIIEKHFTLSRSEPGPDSAFSLEPAEFKAMVDAVRVAELALGPADGAAVTFGISDAQRPSMTFRRSLFVVQDVKAGERFTSRNVRCIRPGYGLAPRYMDTVLQRVAARDVEAGTPLDWNLLGGPAAE